MLEPTPALAQLDVAVHSMLRLLTRALDHCVWWQKLLRPAPRCRSSNSTIVLRQLRRWRAAAGALVVAPFRARARAHVSMRPFKVRNEATPIFYGVPQLPGAFPARVHAAAKLGEKFGARPFRNVPEAAPVRVEALGCGYLDERAQSAALEVVQARDGQQNLFISSHAERPQRVHVVEKVSRVPTNAHKRPQLPLLGHGHEEL